MMVLADMSTAPHHRSRQANHAVIEAKDNNSIVGDGMQQALGYAETLQIPFVFSSDGDGCVGCSWS